eukprot:31017-Pelagococcus_subviridis.AAC.17
MTRGRRPGARLDGLGVRRRGFQEVAAAEVVVAFILERGEVVRERRDRVGGTHRDGRAKETPSSRVVDALERCLHLSRAPAAARETAPPIALHRVRRSESRHGARCVPRDAIPVPDLAAVRPALAGARARRRPRIRPDVPDRRARSPAVLLAVAKPALSPVDTSSPGDQANYEASSPTATSNAGSAWQDAAISRTPPPAAREARRSMSFAERSKANATTEAPTEAPRPGGAEPMPNEGNQVANVRASNARSSFATNKSQSFGGKLKSATGGAAAAARQMQERRKKQQRKVQGGKLLLMQLQEEAGAKEPAVMPAVLRAPPPDPRYTQPTFMSVLKSKMFGQPAVDPVNGRVEQGDPHKIKKSAGYKFRAAKRRAWQKNTGTSKRDDEDFNTLWGRVQRQEALLNLIQKDGKARPCSHWSPYDRVRVVNAVP